MYAKDDGLDLGGNEVSEIVVNNTRFEACFFKGVALSSKNDVIKTHTFTIHFVFQTHYWA